MMENHFTTRVFEERHIEGTNDGESKFETHGNKNAGKKIQTNKDVVALERAPPQTAV